MLNQNVNPTATASLSVRDANKISKRTERDLIHIAILELMPRDGSGIALKDLREGIKVLTDPVQPYASSRSNSYPNGSIGAAKQQWSQYTWGLIDRDPVTDLLIYVDGGLDRALDRFDTPTFRECRDIMIKVRDHQEPAVFEPAEVPEPIAACNVKEPTADVVTKDQDVDLANMIQQQINVKLEEIERLKKMLAVYQGQDV